MYHLFRRTLPTRPAMLIATLTAMLAALSPLAAAGQDASGEEIEIQYRRQAKPSAKEGAPPMALPSELRLEVPPSRPERKSQPATENSSKADTPRSKRGKVGSVRDHVKPRDEAQEAQAQIEERAFEAAAWAARELVESRGRQEYYRAGFHRGLHMAFDDPRVGRWDRRAGVDEGRRDPEAQRRGSDLGYEVAERQAQATAPAAVAEQFHDLGREPRPEPYPQRAAFDSPLPGAREPTLRRVMNDYAFAQVVGRRAYGSEPDPWDIYNRRSYGEVYDSRWGRASEGLRLWIDRQRNEAFWRRLDRAGRQVFERAFEARFRSELGRGFRRLEEAWLAGCDDGWSYGSFVKSEWSYRQGYREGYEQALRAGASTSFDRHFPRIYEVVYRRAFDDWANRAQPEIRGAWLADGDGDGVFSPGEEVRVSYELVNYGGRSADLRLRVEGAVLQGGAELPVYLPRREIARSARPIEARIDPRAQPHTEGRLTLSVAGQTTDLPIRIAYPLELDPQIEVLEQDSLAGRAVLGVTVRNRSTQPASALASLRSGRVPEGGVPGEEVFVRPGGQRRVSFAVTGLDPLDLLAGEAEVRFALDGRGVRYDKLVVRIPERVTDLRHRDLLELMVGLARDRRAPAAQISRAQKLMLRRLEADWRAVIAVGGNPYKEDLKDGTRLTALGDLVATYRAERRGWRRAEVFEQLGPRIEKLAESSPGNHPFLRRSMKKLARQLSP